MNNWPSWITTQKHTGSQYPYYISDFKNEKQFSFDIKDIIKYIPVEKRKLEVSSVIEILHKGYIYGDKTLVKGIKRAPWLAKMNESEEWETSPILKHGTEKRISESLAKK